MSSPEGFSDKILVDSERADKKEILDNALESIKKIEAIVKETNLAFSFEGSDLDEFIKAGDNRALDNVMVHWEVESKESEGYIAQVLLTVERYGTGKSQADVLFTLSVGDLDYDPNVQIFVTFQSSKKEKEWGTYYDILDEEKELSSEIKILLSKLGISNSVSAVSEEEALQKIKGLCEFMKSKLEDSAN